MYRIIVLGLIWLILAGCAAPAETAAAPTPVQPTATAVEETSPAQTPGPIEVEIPGAQGLVLKGTWRLPAGVPAPALLLLHMYGGSRSDWGPLAERLQAAGYAVLAIDLRGHGETGGAEDWTLAEQDVQAAFAWLARQAEVDPARLAVLGASIGANLSLRLGAQQPGVAALLLLSPGLEYFRLPIAGQVEVYGNRPLFLAAADDDPYSADTVRQLAQAAGGRLESIIFPEGGHGTALFDTTPDLADRIQGFLDRELLAR